MKTWKIVSKTEKIMERLRKEGKVTTIDMNSEAMKKMNELCEQIHIESMYKQAMSELSARNFILTD